MNWPGCTLLAAILYSVACIASALGREADIAKKLSNRVADLISVPFQFSYDGHIGSRDDGGRATLNLQPVIPFAISRDWNIISRTILPIIAQGDVAPGSGRQSGLSDVTQSLLLSPHVPGANGVWGISPVFRLPTARDAWTFTLNSEATYDWANEKLTVPINAVIAKLVKFGQQPVSLFVGARYYVLSPEAGPKGLGCQPV